MKKHRSYLNYIALAVSLLLILLDYWIKIFMVDLLETEGNSFLLWDGVFQLTYVKNPGAAFGIFAGKTFLLVGMTGIILAAMIVLMALRKVKSPWLIWSFSLIIGGGIGNIVDRIALGYVVDYLHITLFDFAVFNFADCCVVVGTILMILFFLIFERKEKMYEEKVKQERDKQEETKAVIDENN